MVMKEAYQNKLQAQLDEWGMDIDKLKAEADIKLGCYKELKICDQYNMSLKEGNQ